MWSLKILSGSQAGKEVFLQKGLVLLGRGKDSTVYLPFNGISKKHAQIIIKDSFLEIEDLQSRNGSFIKGKQIKKARLQDGDRFALHDIIFEVRKKQKEALSFHPGFLNAPPPSSDSSPSSPSPAPNQNWLETRQKQVKTYMDKAVFPWIYQLAEWVEFRFLVGAFVLVFVLMVSALSIIPLSTILKDGIEKESLNSAEVIAQTVASGNSTALKQGMHSALSVEYALRRTGVKRAFIISALDGRILAPADLAHTYPKEALIHKARKSEEKLVQRISPSSVLAMIPISTYNPETGGSTPNAYSVVFYNVESLLSVSSEIISLIVQTFLIALILGFILYFFLIQLIEFPIKSINFQLGKALKGDQPSSISISYQSQGIKTMCSHINSALDQIALNKMIQSQSKEPESLPVNRENEIRNLLEMTGFPALAISLEDKMVCALNSIFTEQIGYSEILHQSMEEISDGVLKEHLQQIISQGELNPQELVFGEIQLKEMSLQSACQLIQGEESPAYAVFVFMSNSAEEGVA